MKQVDEASWPRLDRVVAECAAAGLPLERLVILSDDAWTSRPPRVWAHPCGALKNEPVDATADLFEVTPIVERLECLEGLMDRSVVVICERIRFAQPIHGSLFYLRRVGSWGWRWKPLPIPARTARGDA